MSKVVLRAVASMALFGCASLPNTRDSLAMIDTAEGPIIARLDTRRAPEAVCAFANRVRRGDYDKGEFFRASPSQADEGGRISLGLIQASVSASVDTSGSTPFAPVGAEEATPIFLGALALSLRDQQPDPASFFIVTDTPLAAADPTQDIRFVALGSVTSGLEVARRIGRQSVDSQGQFVQPITIRKVTLAGRDLRCGDAR
jgi:cyclophilin family peptidyl-prolyl cis-trans isomerase